MSVKSIGQALETKISEVSWVDSLDRLVNVYNYDVIDWSTLLTPFVQIALDRSEEVFLDTANNEREINFVISIVDRAEDENVERASMEDNMRELIDVIIDLVDDLGTITYSGGHARVVRTSIDPWFVTTPTPQRVVNIRLRFLAVKQI